jgi:Flp pilus assembly protein TadG
MRYRVVSDRKRLICREHGNAALEFAIVLPILLLLVFGIIDFGHAWYMDHLLSNASREGARYGTRYITSGTDPTDRLLPQNLTPSISNYVLYNSSENGGQGGWGLIHLLPADANPQVSISGPGATNTDPTTLAGEDLTVTITARKTWFVIGRLLPGLGSYKVLTVTTTMKCE